MIGTKRKVFILGIIIFLTYQPVKAQAIEQQNNNRSGFTVNSLTYFKTEDTSLTLDVVIDTFNAGEFKTLEQAVLNAGIPKENFWIHFEVTNTAPVASELVIDVDNARLNVLELFEVSGDARRSLGKLGDFYPFSQRTILHKSFLYQVSLLPGQKKAYFLFVNQVGHAFILPVKIFNAKKFSTTTFKDYLFDGVTYGILLFVAIVSLLFFITSGYSLYLFYSFYIITSIIWFLSYFGLGYQYIWGNYPLLNTAVAPCMAAMNVLINIKICQILLRLSKTNRLLNNVANGIKVGLLLLAIFPLVVQLNRYGYTLNHYYLLIFLTTVLLAIMVVSYFVILYAIRGILVARLYLIASLLKAGSIINLALLELGLSPALVNMEGILQVGIFVEITLLTYALAIRYANFKVKTFIKVIEAHEKERSLISKEIHDSISSTLTGINYGIKNFTRDIDHLPPEKIAKLNRIIDELNGVQVEARNISHNTMPDYIKKRTISDIVEKHVEEIQTKIRNNSAAERFTQINFSANEQLVNFSEAVKLNIFRIMQEIFANIIKHSRAANADILFSFNKKEMLIIAEDNGTGFEPEHSLTNKGMGIKNIRSRVELLEGSILIKSPVFKRAPDSPEGITTMPMHYGTMIRIRIPYRNNLLKIKHNHDY